MIYFLTAIGLTTGGSSTVHIYTQTELGRVSVMCRCAALRATDSTHLLYIFFYILYFMCMSFLCIYLFYAYIYLPIHNKPDYEISASGPPTSILLASNTEPEDGLYIGRNM